MSARFLPFGPLVAAASTFVDSAVNPELMNRILRRTVYNPETGCMTWTGGSATQGTYGITTVDRKPELVHRAAYLAYNGSLPAGSLEHESNSIEIHHSCSNRLCCSPDHLEAVTRGEHNRRHAEMRSTISMQEAA